MKRIPIGGLAALFLAIAPASAEERTVTLTVENMTCVSCPYIVEQALEGVAGVIRAEVSLEAGTAVVTFDGAQADVAALTAATADMGFPSRLAAAPGR